MADEMFFSPDAKSLRRGRRGARRTPTCRPCLVWPSDAPEIRLQGVVLDVSPLGMRVRMLEPLPQGVELQIQLMRDEEYREPLARPVEGVVVRHSESSGAFYDHGIHVQRSKPGPGPSPAAPMGGGRREVPMRPASRMHTFDFTVGDHGIHRNSR